MFSMEASMRHKHLCKPAVRSVEERNILAVRNWGLIGKALGVVMSRHPELNLTIGEQEEARAAGVLGLMRACDLWEEKKSKFSTYAMPAIMNHITRWCFRDRWTITYPEKRKVRKFRRLTRRSLPSQEKEDSCDVLQVFDPEPKIDKDDEEERLRRAISHLPAELLEAVHLKFWLGWPYKTMSDYLGITVEGTRQRTRTALAMLKKMLGGLQ